MVLREAINNYEYQRVESRIRELIEAGNYEFILYPKGAVSRCVQGIINDLGGGGAVLY